MDQGASNPTPNSTHTGGAVILLTGLAGIGKTSVAKQLHEQLNPGDPRPVAAYAFKGTFFHHHLINDYVRALMPRNHRAKEHMHHRRRLLNDALDLMKNHEDKDRIFLPTAYVTLGIEGEPMRRQEMQDYINLARFRNIPFLWFHLTCEPEEHRRRIESADRPPTKEKSYDNLMKNLAEESDKALESDQGLDKESITSYCFKRIDTTQNSVSDTTAKIMGESERLLGLSGRLGAQRSQL